MKHSDYMPEPPAAFCKVKDIAPMGQKTGVYFGWRDSKCFYVGRTNDIRVRLKSHQVIKLEDEVSWLEMSNAGSYLNECYYIWALEPECNGQVKGPAMALAHHWAPPLPPPPLVGPPRATHEEMQEAFKRMAYKSFGEAAKAKIKQPLFVRRSQIYLEWLKTKQAPTS